MNWRQVLGRFLHFESLWITVEGCDHLYTVLESGMILEKCPKEGDGRLDKFFTTHFYEQIQKR